MMKSDLPSGRDRLQENDQLLEGDQLTEGNQLLVEGDLSLKTNLKWKFFLWIEGDQAEKIDLALESALLTNSLFVQSESGPFAMSGPIRYDFVMSSTVP
jgi:hypothetical protein